MEARSAFSDSVVLSCAVLCCYVEALSVVLSCIMLCGCVTAGRKTGLVHKGPECVQRVSVVLSCAVLCCVVMYLQAERQACYM